MICIYTEQSVFSAASLIQLLKKLLKCYLPVHNLGSRLLAYIAEVPRFILYASNIFLSLRIPENKAILIAVLLQPSARCRLAKSRLQRRIRRADDIQGKTNLVFARTRHCHRHGRKLVGIHIGIAFFHIRINLAVKQNRLPVIIPVG